MKPSSTKCLKNQKKKNIPLQELTRWYHRIESLQPDQSYSKSPSHPARNQKDHNWVSFQTLMYAMHHKYNQRTRKHGIKGCQEPLRSVQVQRKEQELSVGGSQSNQEKKKINIKGRLDILDIFWDIDTLVGGERGAQRNICARSLKVTILVDLKNCLDLIDYYSKNKFINKF